VFRREPDAERVVVWVGWCRLCDCCVASGWDRDTTVDEVARWWVCPECSEPVSDVRKAP